MFTELNNMARSLVYSVPPLARLFRRLRDRKWTRYPAKTEEGFSIYAPQSMLRRDHDERALFAAEAKLSDVCVDVGAHVGYFTCIACAVRTPTLAIEPFADNLDVLYRNLALNNFSSVEVFPMGLGARPGVAPIYGYSDVASLLPAWSSSARTQTGVVAVSTLDILLEGRFPNQKLLIKIDVEGLEREVLAGGAQTLKRDPKPVWIVEILYRNLMTGVINKNFADTFNLFWQGSYDSFWIEGGLRPISPTDVAGWSAGVEPAPSGNFLFRGR
jgi:FkbM family methyltransferase